MFNTMDDTLITKMVMTEQDTLRQMTGNESLAYTPHAFTSKGEVD